MRVLLLSRYCRLGASSRMRCLQYLPMLAKWGIDVDTKELYDRAYLIDLYQYNRRRFYQNALQLCETYFTAAEIPPI
jgi:D-lyxose ketol-isomerase